MEQWVFEGLCGVAYEEAGISMSDAKRQLVSARVGKRVRALKLADHEAYLKYLKADTSREELTRFLDVITTNFTSFYREPDHFETLSEYVRSPRIVTQKSVTIWCAAAATGEEPYTLALTLKQAAPASARLRILATDLSTRALARCREGIYEAATVNSVAPGLRKKYFKELPDGRFQAGDELKSLLTFGRLNLAKPPFPMQGPLDAVFIRNVMIYFDRPVRQALIAEAERMLVPGGLLFTGHAETLAGLKTCLEVVRPSVYRKPAHGGSRSIH